MSELKMVISNEHGKSQLHLKDLSEGLMQKAESHFFEIMGGHKVSQLDVPSKALAETISPMKRIDRWKRHPELPDIQEIAHDAQTSVKKSMSKQLPKIDGGRTLSVPMAELIQGKETVNPKPKNEEPDYYKTGIKDIKGIKHYKTRVFCKSSECGVQRNEYIPEGKGSVRCRDCNTEHIVRQASKEGFPQRDHYGNYYVADALKKGE